LVHRVGIDFGTRRIGLAVSEPGLDMAWPWTTVVLQPGLSTRKVAEQVAEQLTQRTFDEIVVGLPLRTTGQAGPEALRAQAFAQDLQDVTSIPVQLWDERLTTWAVTRQLRSAGLSSKKMRHVVDQAAAVRILQNYLDHKSRLSSDEDV